MDSIIHDVNWPDFHWEDGLDLPPIIANNCKSILGDVDVSYVERS